jgi:hypothetical protein
LKPTDDDRPRGRIGHNPGTDDGGQAGEFLDPSGDSDAGKDDPHKAEGWLKAHGD